MGGGFHNDNERHVRESVRLPVTIAAFWWKSTFLRVMSQSQKWTGFSDHILEYVVVSRNTQLKLSTIWTQKQKAQFRALAEGIEQQQDDTAGDHTGQDDCVASFPQVDPVYQRVDGGKPICRLVKGFFHSHVPRCTPSRTIAVPCIHPYQ